MVFMLWLINVSLIRKKCMVLFTNLLGKLLLKKWSAQNGIFIKINSVHFKLNTTLSIVFCIIIQEIG